VNGSVKVGVVLASVAAAATAAVLVLPAQAAPEPDQLSVGISRVDPGDGVAQPQSSPVDQGPRTVEEERQLANDSSQTYTVDSSDVGRR
jgi:hypothetical protein